MPAEWLRRGSNEIVVLELESNRQRSVQGLTDPVYATPVAMSPATDTH